MTQLFETPRLIVNTAQTEDLDNYIDLYMSPDVRQLMYTKAKDKQQITEWIEESRQHQTQHGFSDGTVIEKATGKFIGRAQITFQSVLQSYMLHPHSDIILDSLFLA